jgi:hypothetical protein
LSQIEIDARIGKVILFMGLWFCGFVPIILFLLDGPVAAYESIFATIFPAIATVLMYYFSRWAVAKWFKENKFIDANDLIGLICLATFIACTSIGEGIYHYLELHKKLPI